MVVLVDLEVARELPTLPLRERCLEYAMVSSLLGLLGLPSRLRTSGVSLSRCSLGIGTGLCFATGIRDLPLPWDIECASVSSKISSGRLRSQLGMSMVLVSMDAALEFFLDRETVYSDPPIDRAELLALSWL